MTRRGNAVSYREKTTWISLLAMAAVYGWYFWNVMPVLAARHGGSRAPDAVIVWRRFLAGQGDVHDRTVDERHAGSKYRRREDPGLSSSCARNGGGPGLNYRLVAW